MMKITALATGIVALGLSFSSLADLKLSLPYHAELLLVNGKATAAEKELTLANGTQQIVFRYQASFYQKGQGGVYRSDAIILKFSGADQHYQLTLPSLRTEQALSAFNQRPEISLTDSQGKAVSFSQDKLVKAGLQLDRDLETELAEYNQSDRPAALKLPASTAQLKLPASTTQKAAQTTALEVRAQALTQATPPAVSTPKPSSDEKPLDIEQILHFWYQQADQATKARFKASIMNEE